MLKISIALIAVLLACKSKDSGEQGAKPSSETPTTTGTPMDNTECKDYKAVVEKAQSCEKMSQQERDTIKKEYDEHVSEWTRGPADPKGVIAKACGANATMIRAGADPACGL